MSDGIYAPTPEKIKEVCKEIQAGWSPQQRNQRWWGEKPKHVETQVIRTSDLPGSVADWIESINTQDEKETKGD